jgi:predicted proteasome-type protease
MYALVQRHAQPGERVLVIGGQGHIAIMRQLLADDRDREAVDVHPYLN